MTRIRFGAEVTQRLAQFDEPVEICDESGQMIGVFRPVVRFEDIEIEDPLTDEEMERRRQNRTGRPLREILADLNRR